MFEASHPFAFFDYFRVPYRVVSLAAVPRWCGRLEASAHGAGGPFLVWPRFSALAASELAGVLAPGEFAIDGVRGYGRLVPDGLARRWLDDATSPWRPTSPVRDRRGEVVASVWEDRQGSRFLPFEPDEVITSYWTERYRAVAPGSRLAGVRRLGLRAYYRVRPFVPRSLQIRLRRRLSCVQARSAFPRWPVETALHDFYARLFRWVADVADGPVPYIAPWPAGRSWALVLTHDVETRAGYDDISRLRRLETELGYRSSWNFVPKRYDVEPDLVDDLTASGFEIGVHGLYHDGRDLESLPILRQRLPAIREHARRWGAVGFRSPATHRNWDWMPLLGFDYDSSYPDTDPFEPQSGGCCSWLPFFNRDLVELPITLPQDHTLFTILGHQNERVWVDKAERVKAAGGMALLITHPDYCTTGPGLAAYRALLTRYQNDSSAWPALPRDVSAWWRRRQASRLEPTASGWTVVGPAAAEANVAFAATGWSPSVSPLSGVSRQEQ